MDMTNFKNQSQYQKKTLGEVVDFIDGDRGANYPSQGEFFPSGDCLFLSTKNVPNSKFSFEEKLFIDAEKDAVLRKGKLQRGDYVLTTRGTVGNFAYYDEGVPYENVRINSGMVILRKKSDELYEKFFRYYLSSTSFSGQVKNRVSGSAQPQLPIRDMVSMEIILPDLLTQTRIASVLSAYDDLIENNEKRIKALEEMAQLLYTEWFVKFEFPVNSPPSEGWQAKPDGVVSSPPEAGCLKGGVVSPRNTQNYMSLPYNPKLKERAKELRKAGNLSEVLFWQQVKNGQFKGFDFDRQKIIGNYIVDFYCSNVGVSPPVEGCPQGGVVIEIDGSSHDDKQDYDKERDIYLSSLGLTVVHILDSEVKKNLEGVMVWLNDHPAFQAPVQELPPRLSGTPPKEGNNSPSLKGWQAKPDGVVGYKDAGGKMVDSGTEYGMVPEGWEVKMLGDISFEKRDSINPKKIDPNTPYVGLEHIPRRSIILNEWGLTKEVSSSKLIFKVGDILFGKIRPYFHKVVSAPIDGIASSDTIVISPSDEKYRALVRAYVSSDDFVAYSTKTSQGTKMPRADWKTLAKYSVLVPDDYVANLFNRICNTAINEMNCLMLKNRNLQSIRDLLIPQLVTGKRKLK